MAQASVTIIGSVGSEYKPGSIADWQRETE